MLNELKDGRLTVQYLPERIVATLRNRTWTYPRYLGRVCSLCGNPLEVTNTTDRCGVCTQCYGFSGVSYVSLYDKEVKNTVRRTIFSLKDGREFFADVMGMGMSLVLSNEMSRLSLDSILVSVPTHPEDHPDRDYNPPDMLARRIATHSHLPYRPDTLIKTEPHCQKGFSSSAERFDEILGKFDIISSLDGKTVILVDDLMTTGATASECARMCLKGGAATVRVMLAARNFTLLEDREYG